ncbi:hypothetical protein PoB_002762700 [Plakobranchus ocellatus]|uniref:Uncharacterized protein n=1 Tax=Plakobranchus ocellatus TaxID=259542 RepID=A0AAV4A2M0_9GAST|nr:hypothetical protein PoB_002762700 [Plakobranchus ocellatus]
MTLENDTMGYLLTPALASGTHSRRKTERSNVNMMVEAIGTVSRSLPFSRAPGSSNNEDNCSRCEKVASKRENCHSSRPLFLLFDGLDPSASL